MEAQLKTFFSSPYFAVAGASSDPSKYGHKVFVWYLSHSLPVQALNPRAPSITVSTSDYPTVPSPSKLEWPTKTSLSVITPPKVTLELLKEAKEVGVPAVWLQPGSFNKEVEDYARSNFEAVLAGMEGSRAHDGWCVLVDGERGLGVANRRWESVRL